MPLTSDQKVRLVQLEGYDPSQFTTDEEGNNIIPIYAAQEALKQPSAGPEVLIPQVPATTPDSPLTTFGKSFAQAAPTAVGSGTGLAGGALIGSYFGPVGTVIGGIIGAFTGGGLSGKIQEEVEPEAWQANVQQSAATNPLSAFAGDIASIPLGGFNPSPTRAIKAVGSLARGVTGMPLKAPEIANLANVGFGGAIGGGMSIGSNIAQGQPIDIPAALENFGIGALFNKPNVIGRSVGFHDADIPTIHDILKGTLNAPPQTTPFTLAQIEQFKKEQNALNVKGKGTVKVDEPTESSTQSLADIVAALDARDAAKMEENRQTIAQMNRAFEVKEAARMAAEKEEQVREIEAKALKVKEAEMNARWKAAEAAQKQAEDTIRQEAATKKQAEIDAAYAEMARQRGEEAKFSPEPAPLNENSLRILNKDNLIGSDITRPEEDFSSRESAASSLSARLRQDQATRPATTVKSEVGLPTTEYERSIYEQVKNRASRPTAEWFKRFIDWVSKEKGIEVDVNGRLYNKETKRPIAGRIILQDGVAKLINLNLKGKNAAGTDTMPHELAHALIGFMRRSTRPRDIEFIKRYDALVEASPDYQRWKVERDARKLNSDPEEYQATNEGYRFLERHLNLQNEKPFQNWMNDWKSYLKTRFGKHASEEDFRRFLDYKLTFENKKFSDYAASGKSGILSGFTGARTKNAEQSTLPGYDDKEVRASSEFARMREAIDNPTQAERYARDNVVADLGEKPPYVDLESAGSKLAPAVYAHEFPLPEDSKKYGIPARKYYHLTEDIPGHPKGSTVTEDTIRKAGFEVPPSDVVGELPQLNAEESKLTADDIKAIETRINSKNEDQLKEAGLKKVKPDFVPPFSDDVRDILKRGFSKSDDATISEEEGEKYRRALLDKVDWSELPQIPFLIEKMDVIDPDDWKQLRLLYENAFESVRTSTPPPSAKVEKPIEVPRWIPESELEVNKPKIKSIAPEMHVPAATTKANKGSKDKTGTRMINIESLGTKMSLPEDKYFELIKPIEEEYKRAGHEVVDMDMVNYTMIHRKLLPISESLKKTSPDFSSDESEHNKKLWQAIDETKDPQQTADYIKAELDAFVAIANKSHGMASSESARLNQLISVRRMQYHYITDKYKLVKKPDEFKYSDVSLLPSVLKSEVDKIRDLDSPSANLVADAATKFYQYRRAYTGSLTNDFLNKVFPYIDRFNLKYRWLQNTPEFDRVVKRRFEMQDDGESSITLTPREQEIDKILSESLQKSLAEKNSFADLRASIADPNYIPFIPSRKVLNTLLNKSGSTEARKLIADWYDYYVNKLGKTKDEADNALKTFKGGFTKQEVNLAEQFGPIDKSEGLGIPPSWRETNLVDIMTKFNNRYGRRLAYHKAFEQDPTIVSTLKDPAEGLEGADVVKNVLEDIYGVREQEEAVRTAAGGIVRAAMMGPLTGAKDFVSNLTLGMQHQTLPQTFMSPLKAWAELGQNIRETFETGVNRHNIAAIEMGDDGVGKMVNTLRRFRDIVNVAQGRNFLEKVTRATAFGQAKYIAADNLWKIHKGSSGSQAEKFLNDFAPENWKDYVSTGEFPPEVLKEISAKYVESVQGTYDYRGLPSIAQKGTFAPYLSLARWNVEKLNNYQKYVVKPLFNGNPTPFLMSTIGMIIGGQAVTKLVEQVTGRKEKTPTVEELQTLQQEGENIALPLTYKAAGLASLSGYAGLYGDVVKAGMDLAFKNRPQTYNNPLVGGMETIYQNVADFIDAAQNGDITPSSYVDFAAQVLQDSFQAYRIVQAQTSEDKQEELEKQNKFRDLKVFKTTHGLPVGNTTTDRSNPFSSEKIKKFKKESDISKAAQMLPELIQAAFEKANGNAEIFQSELAKIKQNSYQTMPNPDKIPRTFLRYLNFIAATQGADKASERMLDYFRQNAVNKAKSSMVPDL